MKRMVVLASVLVVLALLPASAAAIAPLGKAEAKAAATGALLAYYGDTWRYGTEKTVGFGERLSRTRWELAYQFDYEPGEACYGVVTAWRGRKGRIFTKVQPNPELTNPYCR
jgi:opacity protein-like surface antigen